MITHYASIALVDFSYLFKRNYMGAGIGAAPNAGAERTLEDLRAIHADVGHMIVCLDAPPYIRKERFDGYKASRPEPDPVEWQQKKAVLKEIRRLGYAIAKAAGHEADDCIATLAKVLAPQCDDVRLVASDKDIAQCITKGATQYVPASGDRDAERRDALACKKKFGVLPHEMRLWQALVGDKGDDVPGVKDIGPMRAASVIEALTEEGFAPDLEGLARWMAGPSAQKDPNAKKIATYWENCKLSYELVTLSTEVPLDIEELLRPHDPVIESTAELAFERNETPVPAAVWEPEPQAKQALAQLAVENEQYRQRKADRAAEEAYEREQQQERKADEVRDKIQKAASEARERIAHGLIDESGRENPEGPRKVLTEAQQKLFNAEQAEKSRAMTANVNAVTRSARAEEARIASLIKQAEEFGLVDSKLQPLDLNAAITISRWLHKGGLYKALAGEHAIFTVIMRGRELGLGVTTALAGFHVIEGKPSASADLIRSLAERDPNCMYFQFVESDDEHATWATKHRNHPRETVFTYTRKEALTVPEYWKKDRWGNPSNWEKRPRDLLTKTAGSKLARLVYPGACLGLYCPEELGADVLDTVGEAA